jgi:integrase
MSATAEKIVFTDPYIRALKAPGVERDTKAGQPYKRSEWAPKGEGRLMVRVTPTTEGAIKEFFYRYRYLDGKKEIDKLLALGRYDYAGKNGKTLAAIRATLRKHRDLQRETGDVKEHLEAQDRKKDVERRRGSLGQLMDAYVESLRAAGKPSADEVAGIFRRNVTEAFPQLADTKASEIEPGDIQRILARMVKNGITRQVNITRAYLRAAFTYGGKADHDARTMADEGVLFGLKSNPVMLVPIIRDYENTGDRKLDADELRAYWHSLEALPLAQKATLRFNLALACQRVKQLIRADWESFDWNLSVEPEGNTKGYEGPVLTLRDTKGKGKARDHLIPLSDFALEQLKPLRQLNHEKDSPPFSFDGKRRIDPGTLSNTVTDISKALKKEHGYKPFTLRDLRRTSETMLQRLGVDKEVRAHLLSHGRSSGVQGKHYERYDFLPEKRAALEKWADHLQRVIDPSRKAKVVELSKRRGAAS